MRGWMLGGIGIVLSIAMRPDSLVLPLNDSMVIPLLSLGSDWLGVKALLTSIVGGSVAVGIGWLWRIRDDRAGWLGACCLIGLSLGWQASLWILMLTGISLWIATKVNLTRVRYLDAIGEAPLRYLWFWTTVFLLLWRPLHALVDIL